MHDEWCKLKLNVCSFSGRTVVLPYLSPSACFQNLPRSSLTIPIFAYQSHCLIRAVRRCHSHFFFDKATVPPIVTQCLLHEGQWAWSVRRGARKSPVISKHAAFSCFIKSREMRTPRTENVHCFPLSCYTRSGLGEGIGWTPGFEKSSSAI